MSSEIQSVHQPTSFPPTRLTEDQQRILNDYLDHQEATEINRYDPIWLVLLVARKRPGIVLMTLQSSWGPTPEITKEEIAEAFDLHYLESDKDSIFVARTEWRLEFLPTTCEGTAWHHRRLGCFLGYPQQDIEAFIQGNHTAPLEVQEESSNHISPRETAYTTFVPQLHTDSAEGRKRGIQIGKENYETVLEIADLWNYPRLGQFAEQLFQETVADQSEFSFA